MPRHLFQSLKYLTKASFKLSLIIDKQKSEVYLSLFSFRFLGKQISSKWKCTDDALSVMTQKIIYFTTGLIMAYNLQNLIPIVYSYREHFIIYY